MRAAPWRTKRHMLSERGPRAECKTGSVSVPRKPSSHPASTMAQKLRNHSFRWLKRSTSARSIADKISDRRPDQAMDQLEKLLRLRKGTNVPAPLSCGCGTTGHLILAWGEDDLLTIALSKTIMWRCGTLSAWSDQWRAVYRVI